VKTPRISTTRCMPSRMPRAIASSSRLPT
jgi:hypothetical protein